jgi:hypothetical protein
VTDVQLTCDGVVPCPGTDFEELAVHVLEGGYDLRFRARGSSMFPLLRDGDILDVQPIGETSSIRSGEIVLYRSLGRGIVVHRVVGILREGEEGILLVKGDAAHTPEPQVPASNVLGRVVSTERQGRRRPAGGWAARRSAPVFVRAYRLRRWVDGALQRAWRELRSAAGAAGYGP